jgi:single-strand DNA-binding protein
MAERSVNKVILVGRAGNDADARVTPNGTPVSRLSLAMNRQWTDGDNQVHEETDWMTVIIWRKERIAEYLTKGARLYVEGRLQTRSYEDKEGVKRYVTEVVAENVILLGGNGAGNGSGTRESSEDRPRPGKPASRRAVQPQAGDEVVEGDVPF